MGLSRNILRAEAKKLYKEQTKGILKRERISFSIFFKKYKGLKNKDDMNNTKIIPNTDEDFDIENIINVNNINDDDIELPINVDEDFDIESIINVNDISDKS